MEEIFVGIGWTSGTKEEAVARAKALFKAKGWDTGSFQEEQEVEEHRETCGNLEVQEGLYEDVAESSGYWSATDGVVTVQFECS